jgi:hypothetical protein
VDEGAAKHDAGRNCRIGGGPERPLGRAQGSREGRFGVVAAKSNAESNELIKAVASDFETPQARSDVQKALKDCFAGAQPTDCVQRSLAHLRDVSKILDAKAPADAAAFKTWLRSIGQNVAEAASEGSFLGFGGVRVSDAEKATLDDIAEALGATA